MKIGDLVKKRYSYGTNLSASKMNKFGMIVGFKSCNDQPVGDVLVLCAAGVKSWFHWACEVIYEEC